MNIAQVITQELGISPQQTEAVIRLIDEGNTIPFIARYRKEMTGAMNDEVLRKFDERLRSLRALEERRQTVLTTIEGLGQLTDELRARVEGAMTSVELEDIYRPYRPKRRTRAMIAGEGASRPCRVHSVRRGGAGGNGGQEVCGPGERGSGCPDCPLHGEGYHRGDGFGQRGFPHLHPEYDCERGNAGYREEGCAGKCFRYLIGRREGRRQSFRCEGGGKDRGGAEQEAGGPEERRLAHLCQE